VTEHRLQEDQEQDPKLQVLHTYSSSSIRGQAPCWSIAASVVRCHCSWA